MITVTSAGRQFPRTAAAPAAVTPPPNTVDGEEGGNIYEDGIVDGTPKYKEPTVTEPTTNTESAGNNGKGKTVILIVTIALAVLLGGAVAVYFFVIKPKKLSK